MGNMYKLASDALRFVTVECLCLGRLINDALPKLEAVVESQYYIRLYRWEYTCSMSSFSY